MSSKYDAVENGVPFKIRLGKRCLKLACCDCSLVHDFDIKFISKNEIELTIHRNNRATAAMRTANKKRKKL